MQPTFGFFDVENLDATLILTPKSDMGELDHERISDGMKEVLQALDAATVKNLVLDFHRTTYYGSTALGFFVRLWKTICTRNGRMAFCNLSDHEREILEITRLDDLWHISTTREEALKFVNQK
jgi:anti-anti-sigma factor